MQALGVDDVRAALDKLGIDAKIIEFDSPTATSQQAADNVGCALGQIVKSLGFIINRTQPVLVLASGDSSIDDRKLAKRYGVGRKKARMMKAGECLELLGYAPGGVPPIAHRRDGIPILMDKSLTRYESLYTSSGAANALLPISREDLRRITNAEIVDLARVG